MIVDAIRRFEAMRGVLGHELILTPRLLGRLRKYAKGKGPGEVLVRYSEMLNGLRVGEARRMGANTSVLPEVDLGGRINHVTCTGDTVITVLHEGVDWVIKIVRPRKAFKPGEGRDAALVWLAGGNAGDYYPQSARGGRGRPTDGAAVDAVARLAVLGLDDAEIVALAELASYTLDIGRAWVEIGRLRRPRFCLGFRWYWWGWKARHPEDTEPQPSSYECRLWQDAVYGAGRGHVVGQVTPVRLAHASAPTEASAQPGIDAGELAEWERQLLEGR